MRGVASFNNGRGTFDCLIRDISVDGARLVFSSAVSIPDILELYIPQKDQTWPARVTWRQGDDVGVKFLQSQAMGQLNKSDDLAQRVVQLEIEIAALKRMLKSLKVDVGVETNVA